MPTLLNWRDAKRQDRHEFERFQCTEGEARISFGAGGRQIDHPRPYEFEVQEMIQQARPPLPRRFTTRVARDAQGIAAVSVSEELAAGKAYELNFAALHNRLRRSVPRQPYALEMMQDTLDQITTKCLALGVNGVVEVFGYIDPANHNSKRMCGEVGLTFQGMDSESPYEVWKHELIINQQD